MSDPVVLCGEVRRHPVTAVEVGCELPEGHRTAIHRHMMVPHIMHWPVSTAITCRAWRRVNTAMGDAVVFCTILPSLHRPGDHEGRIGIQPIGWTDAQLNKAGRLSAQIRKMLAEEYEAGELVPSYRDMNRRFATSETTVLAALEILARDGVVQRHGRRWKVL